MMTAGRPAHSEDRHIPQRRLRHARLLWQNRVVVSILRKERQVVRHFRDAGAISPSSAKSLEEVPEAHSLGLRRLRRRAVIREAQPDRFYLDEEVWVALGRTRLRVSLAVLALIVLLLVGVVAVSRLIAPT
jgi:hypothetical protein